MQVLLVGDFWMRLLLFEIGDKKCSLVKLAALMAKLIAYNTGT